MTAGKRTHWASINESTFVMGIRILFVVHRLFGRPVFRVFLAPVVGFFWAFKPLIRNASLDYLQTLQLHNGALGHLPNWRDGFRHIFLFAETMLDKLLAVSGHPVLDQVKISGAEPILEAMQKGRGGVIVTAHLGCLELCQALAQKLPLAPINILVHTKHAEQFNSVLRKLNPKVQANFLEVTELNPSSAIMLAQKLSVGEYLVIAGDRVPVQKSKMVQVEFLGRVAHFPIGPYVLANVLDCPLWWMACTHNGDGYTLKFELLAENVLLPRIRRDDALKAYAEKYVSLLTAALAHSPFDWFNFFPFWEQGNARDAHHA